MDKKLYPALIFAVIILIFYIIYEYKRYKKNKKKRKNQLNPPYISECPDYWKIVGKNKCEKHPDIGIPDCSPEGHSRMINHVVDFNKSKYKGRNGDKNKCNWSKSCQVPWEGISDLCV